MSHLSDFQVFILLSILKIAVVLVITLTAVAYTVLLERKVLGRMQNRWGPSRTGPFGLLQPLADGIKLFLKEDMMPLAVERPLFILAPVIALGCALVSISVVPFGASYLYRGVNLTQISDLNIGLLVILGITSIGVYGIALSGWSSNNKFSLFGSLRATAQVISYELALGLSLVGVVLRAGSLRLRDIVGSQSAHGALSWNILGGPARQHTANGTVWVIAGGFQIIGFFIYLMAAYAETNRSPFDLPEAESELVAGYHTEYSSMKFAMFFMAEYANMITVACVATLLFFGGASSPFGHLFDGFLNGPIISILFSIFWFVFKVFAFLLLYIWVRATLPRFRYDQLMGFGWKFLLPVAMLNILGTALVLAYRS
ncbi:MAG TPA: NADH-quinone oxidoreductase subunit NuoH [Acidobacteriaceae bacterium]|nr:NADH-quinone oxidoreductase subunit NuoH [Acidobacteriaceae bacterium]